MAQARNILILSYFFPPCNKVGGRRWAKFGKYLSERGYNVFVICVNVPYAGKCPWEKDIESYKDKIFRLPYIEHRPYYRVHKSPASLGGKIRYRLSLYSEKLFPAKISGDASDASRKYGPLLSKKAGEIIQEKKIDTVVVTGGPFHWCYEGIQLKRKFKSLKFITDLRDFWTGGESYAILNPENRQAEDVKEHACIEYSDAVFSPAERIVDFLKLKYKNHAAKIHLLPHAYDAAELPVASHNPEGSAITFAYGGILYPNMERGIKQLINVLQNIRSAGTPVKLDLYTFDTSYEQLFTAAGLAGLVNYHPTVNPSQLFDVFTTKDYLLQLRAGESMEQHFKSTKFYELIALRRPIVYFGPTGDVSEFITSNKLGYDGNTDAALLAHELIENKKNGSVPDTNFDVSRFDFQSVTTLLETYL